MNREEKLNKMYDYCWDNKCCNNCKVEKNNPNHRCGRGYGYKDNIVSKKRTQ